jgi:hypothetical protein
MRGNAEGSTLRLTLGCLLSAQLGLELRRVDSGTRLTFCDGQRRLSEWLGENAFVAWEVRPEPWVLEHLIRHVPQPLNLDPNGYDPYCPALMAARTMARDAAGRLPVWCPLLHPPKATSKPGRARSPEGFSS